MTHHSGYMRSGSNEASHESESVHGGYMRGGGGSPNTIPGDFGAIGGVVFLSWLVIGIVLG